MPWFIICASRETVASRTGDSLTGMPMVQFDSREAAEAAAPSNCKAGDWQVVEAESMIDAFQRALNMPKWPH